MRRLMRWHRTLSCVAAPLMMFLAISGGWQIFRLHEQRKNSSYHPPEVVQMLSHVHRAERIGGAAGEAYRWMLLAGSVMFLVTAALGVVMAWRITRPRWLVLVWLGVGIALPALLFLAGLSSELH